MIATFKSEWRKLTRRPAVLWLGGLILALVIVYYGFSYIRDISPSFHPDPKQTLAQVKALLYPAQFATGMVDGLAPVLGSALMLIMGALVVGAEYGWSTLKTIYTQRPGRLQTLGGQVLAVTVINAILIVAIFALGAISSWTIATIDGGSTTWPAAIEILEDLGATWLIFEVWATFGMAIAYLFRQSALALGLGLAYMLAVEGILFRALRAFNLDWLTSVEKFFPGQNTAALAQSLAPSTPGAPPVLVSAEQAVIVLTLFIAGFVISSMALVRFRDVV